MKVKFDIECSPEEARAFLGLPDVVPMQEALMKEIQKRLEDNISTLDPEALVKIWMPLALQNWNEWQKMVWGQMGSNMATMNPMANMMGMGAEDQKTRKTKG